MTIDLVKKQSTDAQEWAQEFINTAKKNKWTMEDIDEGLMLTWFATIIETAKDSQHKSCISCESYKDDICTDHKGHYCIFGNRMEDRHIEKIQYD